jgi:peroxiredoxin
MNSSSRLTTAAALSLLLCATAAALNIGDAVPDFARTGLAGSKVTLSGLRGKVVLLNFWATWCAPCREEMPAFSRWQRNYGARGLQIIGVSMDDEPGSVTQMLARRPVSYPVVMGDAKLAESFGGVLGLPLSYLIDAQGRVVARFQGEANLPGMEATIKALLSRHSH